MSTYDHATPERLEWLRSNAPRMGARAHKICWPLPSDPITEAADPTTDAYYKARADKAWEIARQTGKVPTMGEV